MKFGEENLRELSIEHYGKRGIVVHGSLVKYKRNDGSIFKRVCMLVPEGNGTQDAKSAPANVDVLVQIIKE